MLIIDYVKSFKDNYIWLLIFGKNVIVVDPGESKPVIDYITTNNLNLHSIVITHTHNDQIGGVIGLLDFKLVDIYGMWEMASKKVYDGAIFNIMKNIMICAISTSGHTIDGFSYLVNNQHLFCGDTLFASGCGRVLTGDYNAMYNSLNKIKNLPKNTLVYPAHEYTLSNLEFAKYIEPKNIDIAHRYKNIVIKRQLGENTLPTTLELELKTNPFLRCDKISLGLNAKTTELETFIKIRQLKDKF